MYKNKQKLVDMIACRHFVISAISRKSEDEKRSYTPDEVREIAGYMDDLDRYLIYRRCGIREAVIL